MPRDSQQAPDDAMTLRSAGVRHVTWVGMVVNLLLAALKLACGVLGRSAAVVADAVHSISDCITDIAVLVGVRYWSQPPDHDHPHGHRRIETVVTILIGISLAVVGIGLGYRGFVAIISDRPHPPPGLVALIAAFVSLVSKELLYRWTVVRGRQLKSSAVIANAWHHRSDAFSSVPAFLAVGGAILVPGWWMLDHIGAVVVSLFILHAAIKIVKPAYGELIDEGASRKVCRRIEELSRAVPGVQDVHEVRTRYLGGGLQVDLHVQVDSAMTVGEGHDISHEVEQRLLDDGPDVLDVLVHLEPHESEGKD